MTRQEQEITDSKSADALQQSADSPPESAYNSINTNEGDEVTVEPWMRHITHLFIITHCTHMKLTDENKIDQTKQQNNIISCYFFPFWHQIGIKIYPDLTSTMLFNL